MAGRARRWFVRFLKFLPLLIVFGGVATYIWWPQRIVRVVLALAVLAAGIGVMRYLIATKPEPPKVEREHLGELVEVVTVTPEEQTVEVLANGQIVPAKAVALVGRSKEITSEFRFKVMGPLRSM